MKKLDFKTAFKYPFNRATGMLNILWILLPIIGWFALIGYSIRIIKEFSEGKFDRLPNFKFKKDLELGFFMLIKALPFIIAYAVVMGILGKISTALSETVNILLMIFAVPILGINFANKQTINSFFEFNILKAVSDNLKDYVIAIFKSLLLGIVFLAMWLVLVGIPAGSFTKNIFIADFYRRRVKGDN